MLGQHRNLLQTNEHEFANMDTEKMLTQLIRAGKFDRTDYETVKNQRTTEAKNAKIIELLPGRGSDAFNIFFQILCSIDDRLACKLQPVRHRILWFTSSPKHAAAVDYTLQTYYRGTLSATERRNSKKNYLLRRGRILKRPINSESDPDQVLLARDVELLLAFPKSEKGDTPHKALLEVFEDHGAEMQVAVLSGTCQEVRPDSREEMGVKSGEVVVATEAVSLGCPTKELPLSSALANAKARLAHLSERKPKWLKEAITKLKLDQLPMPHYDAIRHSGHDTPPAGTCPPRALATDSDTYLFYTECASKLGVQRPWFSCKGVMSYDMLNNSDPSQGEETDCVLMSTFVAMEACDAIVEELRRLAT